MWHGSVLADRWTCTDERTEYRLQALTARPMCTPMYYTCTVVFQSPPREKLGTASVCIIPTTAHVSNYVIALCVFKSICFENNYVMPLTTLLRWCEIQVTNAMS